MRSLTVLTAANESTGPGLGAIVFAVIVGMIIAAVLKASDSAKSSAKGNKTLGAQAVRAGGFNYLGGHPACAASLTNARVAATEEWLAVETDRGDLAFKIAMKKVQDITVETDVEARQRLTMTRLALVGVFALAMPKKIAGSVLVTITTTEGPLLFERADSSKSQVLEATAELRTKILRYGL